MTPFQKKVYRAARRIPRGSVTTYKLLARHIHCRSCRAVGQALKQNPFPVKVPCHRVIASDLTIGGFRGKTAGPDIKRKQNLLAREGVLFKNGKLLDPTQIHRYI